MAESMMKTILLRSSFIFEGSNLIDCVRQTCIELKDLPNKEEITSFLKDSIKFLNQDLPFNTVNEISAAILLCISTNPNKYSCISSHFLKRAKKNCNFLIITSLIFSYLIYVQPQPQLPEYQQFFDEALSEILPQINEKELKIFGLKISPFYINSLIIDLLLSCTLTEDKFLSFFPYLFSNNLLSNNPKFNLLIKCISKSEKNCISKQTEASNNDICEFIKRKGDQSIYSLSVEAISLIENVVIFIKCQEINEINGLTKETILQFLAILITIIKQYKIKEKVSFSDTKFLALLIEATKYLKDTKSHVFVESINLILSDYFYISGTLSIPTEILFKIFNILLKQFQNNNLKADKLIFFQTIFDLIDKIKYYNFRNQVINFFKTKNKLFIQLILNNLKIINEDPFLKITKLNLAYLDQSLIMPKFSLNENTYEIIYFLDYCCMGISKSQIEKKSSQFTQYLNYLINEKKWKEVLVVSKFMKNYGLKDCIQFLKDIDNIPLNITESLFTYSINTSLELDKIITHILADPRPEKSDQILEVLFKRITDTREILLSHFLFLLMKYIESNYYTIERFLTLYEDEYRLYNNRMLDAVNIVFEYQAESQKLFIRPVLFAHYYPESIRRLDIYQKIIPNLFEEIEKKPDNYQAFYCLMSMASSIPILFIDFSQKIFEIVYSVLDYFSFIFDNKEDNEHLPFIKSAYCAFRFLLATFRLAVLIDHFYNWAFSHIKSFSDIQVLFTFIALNILNQDSRVKNLAQIYIKKLNILDIISQLIQRNVQEGYFMNCYKDNIYTYLTHAYDSFNNADINTVIQNFQLSQKENPISYAFIYIFPRFPIFDENAFNIEVKSPLLIEFIKCTKEPRKYWLSYDFNEKRKTKPSIEIINNFISKFPNSKPLPPENAQLPVLNGPFTFKMLRYATIQKYWYIQMLIYSRVEFLTNEMFEALSKIINNLNLLREYAYEHPNEEGEMDADTLTLIDFYLPQYRQESLILNLIKDFFLPSFNSTCFTSLCNLFTTYTKNTLFLSLFLSTMSNCFNDIYEKCIGFAPPYLLKVMYDLIDLLTKLAQSNEIEEYFFEKCGNNLLDIVLRPEMRYDPILLWKVSNLFQKFKNLPIRATQLIGFMIVINNENVLKAAISLCSKFTYDQLKGINQLILNAFDNEIKNEKRKSLLIVFIKYSPTIFENRKQIMFSILENLYLKLSKQKNENIIDLFCVIMNKLAPSRIDFSDFIPTNEKITKVPQQIKEKYPLFWDFFEKSKDIILKMINDDVFYLNKFTFLIDYPEFIDFKSRSSYFRKKMKEQMNSESKLFLHVDLNDIFSSSYKCLIDKPKEELLKKFYIIFEPSSSTIDYGGPSRQWFTNLSKEIFNGKYGLFDCKKNMSYQPRSTSNIHEDCLQYFKFAGIFIACALIQGQCIDAHLTTSFIKQILHQKLNLKDLEDVDEQLFNSLNWLLENDVNDLDLYFEIDVEEFGVHKTIPLKENGSQIKVTNENKNEYVELNSIFSLRNKIEEQVNSFCEGFDMLIPHEKIKFFSPKEFDLLICGVTDINVNDMIQNTVFEYPYTAESPVIKMFFKEIKAWDNEKLSKLLFFMTGTPRIPANGFNEFVEITGFPLKIAAGGDENSLPKAHTCFNTIDLPNYTNEEDLRNKLLYAIQECNTFEFI